MPFGVSNSVKRGTMRTYGRQRSLSERCRDLDRPHTVVRMDAKGNAIRTTILPNNAIKRNPLPDSNDSLVSQASTAPTSARKHPTTPARRSSLLELNSSLASSPLSPSENPFSDPAAQDSPSPPSSSPARSFGTATSIPTLKHRSSTLEPLAESSASTSNARVYKNSAGTKPAKRPRLTQMRIDLGGDVRKRCKQCGMEYVPSEAEDAGLHRQFHSMNVQGVPLGRSLVHEREPLQRLGTRDAILMCDRHSSVAARRKVWEVLEVVRADLGAVAITEKELWQSGSDSTAAEPRGQRPGKPVAAPKEKECRDGIKAILYCEADRCVGLCLVQRVQKASRVVRGPITSSENESKTLAVDSAALSTEPSLDPVLLGISRIWTSKNHRRQGIATLLLETARQRYFYGIQVPKAMVAFSQPTENGSCLAERWHGRRDGWLVYTE